MRANYKQGSSNYHEHHHHHPGHVSMAGVDQHQQARYTDLSGSNGHSHHPLVNGGGVSASAATDADATVRYGAEEKKAIFAAARGHSNGSSAFSSNRSVHFVEQQQHLQHEEEEKHQHRNRSLGVGVADDKGSVDEDEGEGEGDAGSSALSHPTLPKTSSYFAHSRRTQQQQSKDDCDEVDTAAAAAAVEVEQAIAVSEATSQSTREAPPAAPTDYRRMLPKLNARGLPKWESLAKQLHLPLHVVKLAVKARLGQLVNLEDEEEEEEVTAMGLDTGEGGGGMEWQQYADSADPGDAGLRAVDSWD